MTSHRPLYGLLHLSSLLLPLLLAACSGGDSDTGGDGGTPSAGGSSGTGGSGASTGGFAGSTGGSGGTTGGSAGKGTGGSAGTSSQVTCATNNDCAGLLPDTKPASCARAFCDTGSHVCRFAAKDFDGDGHGTTLCASQDAGITIELGDDCDDTDPDVFPGSWDGPKGDGQPERCDDGKDNNCNGKVDDGALDDGTTCKCTPGDVRKCSADSAGKPITFPGGTPQGLCTFGNQTCSDKGKWGECTGAIVPTDEICDGKDNDCDGQTDEDDALNKKNWYWDADGDNHGDKSFKPVLACNPPSKAPDGCVDSNTTSCTWTDEAWRTSAFADDCNDKDPTTNPEAKEICDGADNNCDGTPDEGATNAVTWYRDEDGDGYLNEDLAALVTQTLCGNPGLDASNCPAGQTTCESLWIKEGSAKFTDCDDTTSTVHPGAWDGPAIPARMGFVAPGLTTELFKISSTPAPVPDLSKLIPADKRIDVTINYNIALGSLSVNTRSDLAARWSGQIQVTEDGEYTFYPQTDDGVRLWVGDLTKPIVDKWQGQGATEYTAKVTLTKGTVVPFKMEWFDYDTQGVAILRWAGPGFTKQPITVALEPTAEQQIDRCGQNVDNDCNGVVDDGLIKTKGSNSVLSVGCTSECNPITADPTKNVTRTCGTASSTGICHPGIQYCLPSGTWSQCAGEQLPMPEDCNTVGIDENCNGEQPTDCECTGNATRNCGTCNDGTEKCTNGKWAGCSDPTPGTPMWMTDKDGDGNGATKSTESSCTAPAGKVAYKNNASDNCDSVAFKSDPDCASGWTQTPDNLCWLNTGLSSIPLNQADGIRDGQVGNNGTVGARSYDYELYSATPTIFFRPVRVDGGCYGNGAQIGDSGNPVLVQAECTGPNGAAITIPIYGSEFWSGGLKGALGMNACTFRKVNGWTPFAQGECKLAFRDIKVQTKNIGRRCTW